MDANHPRVFRHRPYLSKRGREISNRAARSIKSNRPEYVKNPDKPRMEDVLEHIQRGDYDMGADAGIFIDLLGEGLDYREAVCWYLYHYCGLDLNEIFYAEEGKECSAPNGVDEKGIQHVKSCVRSAGETLDVEPDFDRSNYMEDA